MARLNVANSSASRRVRTHEGGRAQRVSPEEHLRRAVLTCLLWERAFYEDGNDLAQRIADLVSRVDPAKVAKLAIEARDKMRLRHVPLFLCTELARRRGNGPLVRKTLAEVIRRPDELCETVAMFWRDGRKPCLTRGIKKGLAEAFAKFSEYQLAKWNRDSEIRLRDVLFLCHAKPQSCEQAALWRRLIDNELTVPDTWETALSSGADKKETWTRLLSEKKLGGMAVLFNLRNMINAGVDTQLIRQRLTQGIKMALPFRFVTAARYNPILEDAIEKAMLKGLVEMPPLHGNTGLLVDVSGSMADPLSSKGDTTRMDAGAGLAILLRELCEQVYVATFSRECVLVPPRRGFALRDAVINSQRHGATYLAQALQALRRERAEWRDLDRIIVITDEQSHDGFTAAWTPRAYMLNVASYQNGLGYGSGWTHINGWSERLVDYIQAIEGSDAQT